MGSGRSVAAAVIACVLVSCGEGPTSTPASAAVAPAPPAPRAARVPPRDPRLRDDCGGWEPSAELLDAASAKDAVATIDKMPAAERIDVVRAGLRLADDAAARVCAARLEYQWMDRWECARCVGLLTADVLRPGTGADWEKFRSYLGSVELTPFLRALPPLPWSVDPGAAIGDLHRISRAADIPAYLELGRRPESEIADAAESNIGLLQGWNDEFRDETVAAGTRDLDVPAPAAGTSGLPPRLAAWMRSNFLTQRYDEKEAFRTGVGGWTQRWLWELRPGPRDAELLMALTAHGDSDIDHVAGAATFLMGELSDPATDAFLRGRAADGDDIAVAALARRGDRPSMERIATTAVRDAGFPEFSMPLLMEIDPARARKLVDETLLGADDEPANSLLDGLAEFVPPGAFYEPWGYQWRRTSFDGFESAAVASKVPGTRLARIGTIVPGCRTHALAAAACARLAAGDLPEIHKGSLSEPTEIPAFLETAAPAEFAAALRRILAANRDDAPLATDWLAELGDADAAAALVDVHETFPGDLTRYTRSRSPAVLASLERRVREGLETGAGHPYALAALAVWHGLPADAESAFWQESGGPAFPRAAVDAVLDGRPLDGLAAVLSAEPDVAHGDVGAADDPRVRAYLARLRERRELGLYWYATAELAVLGDSAARTEFWGAMHDGRYRVINDRDLFERTLGWNVAATMPWWIDELRSQCCRIVTGGGDVVDRLLGIDCYQSPWRTPYRRATELWDSADGRFVRSRIAGRWVPAPR